MPRPGVLSLFENTRGNVATIVALLAVPLIMATTAAIELMDMSNSRLRLQEAADAGALSGAVQLGVATMTNGNASIIDAAVVSANNAMIGKTGGSDVAFAAVVNDKRSAVTVTGRMDRKPLIGFMGFGEIQINVTATAEGLQKIPLCVLQTGSGGGIDLHNTAIIRATGCAVHANQDINVGTGALIQADAIQASGKVNGMTQPKGNSGALPIDDPFEKMNLNPTTLCKLLSGPVVPIHLSSGSMSLPPGVHCLPIMVLGTGTLLLQPGEHYFMMPLIMSDNSKLEGDDVILIFGATNVFNFSKNATVRLTARRTGPFAGFLIATSRLNVGSFTIASGNVSQLLGTIYIPNANLVVDTGGSVAQDSAWSVIVAKTVTLRQNPVLVINNRYTGSGVPVPDGVGPTKSAPTLSQ